MRNEIIFFSLDYFPAVGGTEKQVQRLAEAWSAKEIPVSVVTLARSGAPAEETLNNVHIRRIPLSSLPLFSWCSLSRAFSSFLDSREPSTQCVIIQMFNTAALVCAAAAKKRGIPVIVRASAGGKDGNLDKMRRSTLGQWKTGRALENIDVVVAINDQIADEFREEGARVWKISNGVDTAALGPASSDRRAGARQHIGLRPDQPVVLFVGRLDPVKNLDVVLRAWSGVRARVPSAAFVLAGDGPEMSRLCDLAASLGIKDSVQFLGNRSDTTQLYAAADMLVLPSWREGISNALLEAIASGVACVASDIPGNRAVAGDPPAIRLCPPDSTEAWTNAIISILTDSDERETLALSGRSRAESAFSLPAVLSQYETLAAHVRKPVFGKHFPILAYHRVCPPEYGIDVSPAAFDRQMRWLKEQGYRTVPLSEVYDTVRDGGQFPDKGVTITFDDGHKDTATIARPILEKYGFRATVFLNSGLLGKRFWVGGRPPEPVVWHPEIPAAFEKGSSSWRTYEFMTWDDARDLKTSGWEIASHGVTHPYLTKISVEQVAAELAKSKRDLEERLGGPIPFFCYPHGAHNESVRAAVKAAGYEAAVASVSHYGFTNFWIDPYQFERIGIWDSVPFWKFKALVSGNYQRLQAKIPRLAWSIGQKLYRSLR